jgi:hypothetical protein
MAARKPTMRLMKTVNLVMLVLGAVALPRAAHAQLRFCAGRPCPEDGEGGPISAEVDGERAATAPLQRAVLIDAVVLTPALEKANARLGLQQAVIAAIREGGWDPVTVTTDCKDLSCAGAAAAVAKAPYAVVITGRFVKQESYVADIAVSLWREGSVIATRTEAQEEAAGGDSFFPCGPPSGVCTTKLLTSKLQKYTSVLVADEAVAIRVRKKVAAASAPALAAAPPGGAVAVPVSPALGGTGDVTGNTLLSRRLGWGMVIAGGALVGAGIALWAVHDMGVDCHSVAGETDGCRSRLNTQPAAISVGAVGVAALGAGVAILWFGTGERQMKVSVRGSALSFGGRF